MIEPLLTIGGVPVPLPHLLAGGGLVIMLLLLAILSAVRRTSRTRVEEADARAEREEAMEARFGQLLRTQAELSGRMQTIAEVFGSRQVELTRALGDRLDSMTQRIGQNLEGQTRTTTDNLAKLNERLALIDAAQQNITDLSGQVVSLREILSNKQSRGAFGQARMEAIVADGLPASAYEFQATLSNGRRPDCTVRLPNQTGLVVIDAKFPLEAYNAIRAADSDETRRGAASRFRQDVTRHVTDIAERYLIPGETQDTAIMFVPSESIYAELHEGFDDVIQKAYRARVVIVSPSLLMLAIQVMQAVLKDARMREQAGTIQKEVAHLMDDVRRLRERTLNLQRHFGQASTDIGQILTSADKIGSRADRIEALELADEEAEPVPAMPPARLLAGE